jgi:hypothetical protein
MLTASRHLILKADCNISRARRGGLSSKPLAARPTPPAPHRGPRPAVESGESRTGRAALYYTHSQPPVRVPPYCVMQLLARAHCAQGAVHALISRKNRSFPRCFSAGRNPIYLSGCHLNSAAVLQCAEGSATYDSTLPTLRVIRWSKNSHDCGRYPNWPPASGCGCALMAPDQGNLKVSPGAPAPRGVQAHGCA